MYDHYSSKTSQTIKNKITVWSELKRLFGGVCRFPLTLVLVIAPALLALAGGLDFLVNWLYSVSHKGTADTRPTIFVVDCLTDQTRELCKGLYFGSVTSTQKIRLWPLKEPLEPSYLYLILAALAWFAFLSIGNPRLKPIGSFLGRLFYFRFEKSRSKSSENDGLIPGKSDPGAGKAEPVWVLGGLVKRNWDSDPGYFSLFRSENFLPAPYLLSSKILQTNLIIVAPPGKGKTGSIFHPLIHYTRNIKGVSIFFDSKGNDFNPALFDYNFDLRDPAHSIKINLFSGESPAQAGERLSDALIPELGEDKQYFSNIAKDAMATLVSSHFACFNKMPELYQLVEYLTYSSQLERLQTKVLETLKGERKADGLLLVAGINRIIKLIESKNDYLGTLATAIAPFLMGPVAKLLVANPTANSYTIEELLKKPGLVRLGLGVADNPRIAPILGRLFLAQFTFAVLSPGCNAKLLKLAAVDEAHNFITSSIAKGMAHARSNKAGYVLAVQALSQIEEKGRPLLNTIFAVSGTKIVMAGVGDEDAERFSKTFGEVELPYVTHSQSSSQISGKSRSASRTSGHELEFFTGGSGTEHRSSTGQSRTSLTNSVSGEGSNQQLRLRRLFLPSEIRSLPLRYAIIEASDAQGQRWPAQIVNMNRQLVADLEDKLLEEETKARKKISKRNGIVKEEVDEPGLESEKEPTEGNFVRPTFRIESLNFGPPKPDQTRNVPATQNSDVKEDENSFVQVEDDTAISSVSAVQSKSSEEGEQQAQQKDKPADRDPLEEIMFGKLDGEV